MYLKLITAIISFLVVCPFELAIAESGVGSSTSTVWEGEEEGEEQEMGVATDGSTDEDWDRFVQEEHSKLEMLKGKFCRCLINALKNHPEGQYYPVATMYFENRSLEKLLVYVEPKNGACEDMGDTLTIHQSIYQLADTAKRKFDSVVGPGEVEVVSMFCDPILIER